MNLQDQALNHTLHISDAKWREKNKKKINPLAIEMSFNKEFGSKPATIRSNHRHSIIYRLDLSTLGRAEKIIGRSERSLAERS